MCVIVDVNARVRVLVTARRVCVRSDEMRRALYGGGGQSGVEESGGRG